jgi:hypothetical protein
MPSPWSLSTNFGGVRQPGNVGDLEAGKFIDAILGIVFSRKYTLANHVLLKAQHLGGAFSSGDSKA